MIAKDCNVHGCSNITVAKGLCEKHYKRFQRHGHILETRPSDWGCREKHPNYPLWKGLVRDHSAKGQLSSEWAADLWQFVQDIGERPSKEYRLCRKDDTKPFSSENWYWRKVERKTEDAKTYSREYARKYRATDPEFEHKKKLKRYYGITLEQYYEMHDKQGGVCAICKGHETSVCHHTNKIRRLAVDHCHSTGKIRGLLCANCNRGLSSFKDSIRHFQSAIKYIEESL